MVLVINDARWYIFYNLYMQSGSCAAALRCRYCDDTPPFANQHSSASFLINSINETITRYYTALHNLNVAALPSKSVRTVSVLILHILKIMPAIYYPARRLKL